MGQLVPFQVTSPSKSLVAHITNIILFCMDQLVLFQDASLSECLVANITHMISNFCMNPLMYPQVTRTAKVLVAHIKHMLLAENCSVLMTVGWAWLGKSRICLVSQYWL
jgi:hypothetical protein